MQHTHAKFIDETTIEFPPINDNARGIINYFAAPELLEADGYLPFVLAEYPADGKTTRQFMKSEITKSIRAGRKSSPNRKMNLRFRPKNSGGRPISL